MHDKVVTAQNLQEQLIYDGKDAECETVEANRIKVRITKCEHEFQVDPVTGEIESINSDGKPIENKVSIEVDPSSSTTESYKQQVSITVKSSRETITDNSVKILWTTNDSDNEPVGLSKGTDLSVENKDEKTMNSETVYTATASGDYYLWVKASINGKSVSQKFGPYKLLAAPSAKDIIFTPSTVAPTTSLNVKIAPSSNFPGYVLQYQVASYVNSKNWKNYTSQVNITENTTIWARLYNEAEDKEVVSSFVVTNICLHSSGWTDKGDTHYCKLCGYSEQHNFDQDTNSENHRCSTCGAYEKHSFNQDGSFSHKCIECGGRYEHTFVYNDATSHRCSGCGYMEQHSYNSSGECTICGKTCTHEFEYATNSVATCRICGYVCNHGNSSLGSGSITGPDAHFMHDASSKTSTCNYCGYVCELHNWQSYGMYHTCDICGLELQHDYSSTTGQCMTCGYQCLHTWKNGICINCGISCMHNSGSSIYWNNGVCTICGESCDHNYDTSLWMYGRCTKCGMECPHNYDTSLWSNGRCSKCGMECTHSWMDGRCSICGKECEHSYNQSLWSGGVCMTCGMTCSHQYDSSTGRCSICGMECSHYFSNGVCMNCGFADPSYSGS